MDEHDEQNSREDYRQGARNRKVFTTTEFSLGLPNNVLMGCGAVLLGTFVLFTWYATIIMGLVLMPVMFHIHKDDPRALTLWKDVMLQRYNSYEAGTSTRRQLVVLKD